MTATARPCLAALALTLALPGASALAQRATPVQLEGVEVTEHLGATLPLEVPFRDTEGNVVHLADALGGGKPLLLVIAYYRCPRLCSLVLKSVATGLGQLGWRPGDQFRVLTVSFNPDEGPNEARARRRTVLEPLGGRVRPADWPFWTGKKESIDALLRTLGVHVARDPETGQFAHPAVYFAVTPDGRISRYLYGIDVPPSDLKLALLEASDGKTGSAFERVILRCYAYDPATRRYALFIGNFMRAGGAVIFLAVAGVLLGLFRWERRQARAQAAAGEGDGS